MNNFFFFFSFFFSTTPNSVCTIRGCGMTDLKDTNCLYLIGGYNNKGVPIKKNIWINLDEFKKDIENFFVAIYRNL